MQEFDTMQAHVTIHVLAHNHHAVLQRILMAFSRRRLRIQALQFFDLEQGKPAQMQFDLDCQPHHARDVVAQIGAIVEVVRVWQEQLPAAATVTADARRAAA
jgi:acetolactate synthase small subunit